MDISSKKHSEKGQILILIAVSMVLIVVMAALIIDGGNLYVSRRQAQTAADAGALAGAYEHCVMKGKQKDVADAVHEYAVVQNDATNVEDIIITDHNVEVAVSVTKPTFFAAMIGSTTTQAQALAAANCLPPVEMIGNLIPVAWTCRPAVGGVVGDCMVERIPHHIFEEITNSGFDFETQILDVGNKKTAISYQDDLEGYAGEGKSLYIVMDTDSFNENTDCQQNGGPIDCDLNDDGQIDLFAGGNRGWLYLEGNASDLKNVMENGTTNEIPINTWIPGKTGSDDVVIRTAKDYKIGELVFVPVFDKLCTTNDFFNECDYDSSTDSVQEWSGSYTYYRINEFAAFVITCVYDNVQDSCPGRTYAGLGNNDPNTIEGYFIDGYIYNGKPTTGSDLGVYVITLTK
jgi:hypothetical protein